MKIIIKGIISFTGIICISYILSNCIDRGINGIIITSGVGLIGFFVGLIYDVYIKREK